jgi:hypothetical protein
MKCRRKETKIVGKRKRKGEERRHQCRTSMHCNQATETWHKDQQNPTTLMSLRIAKAKANSRILKNLIVSGRL